MSKGISNLAHSDNIEKYNITSDEIKSISEFVENKASKVYGFTVTLKGGEIRNFFISSDLPSDFKELEKLKKY